MDDQSHSEWLIPTQSHNFPKDAYIPQTKSWWNVLELYWTYLFWRLRWWAFGIIGRDYKPWSCHVLVGFMPCLFNTMMTWRNFDMVADHFWFLGWTSECIFRIWLTPYVSLFVLWMVLFCLCAVGKCSSQKLGNATMMSEVRVDAGSAWYSKTCFFAGEHLGGFSSSLWLMKIASLLRLNRNWCRTEWISVNYSSGLEVPWGP